jgi:serralysin
VVSVGVSASFTLRNAGVIEGNALAINVQESDNILPTTARITNTGTITGGTEALSIGVDTANIVNRGTMTGVIGCITNTLGLSDMTIVNEGTLRVDTVAAGVAIAGNTGTDTLRNLGTVVGDVLLGDGTDTIVNDGLIRGTIDMGGSNDTYAGLLGRVTGTVLGGTGFDTLTGGAAADSLDGGVNGDALSGGAGADVLFGRTGNDTINGGTGTDTLTAGGMC